MQKLVGILDDQTNRITSSYRRREAFTGGEMQENVNPDRVRAGRIQSPPSKLELVIILSSQLSIRLKNWAFRGR